MMRRFCDCGHVKYKHRVGVCLECKECVGFVQDFYARTRK